MHDRNAGQPWTDPPLPPCPPLADALQGMDATDRTLFQSVFHSTDGEAIASQVNAFCQSQLGHAIADCEFWEISVSAVFGVVLENGDRVVIKARSEQTSLDLLNAVSQVQNAMADKGYPCPRVRVFPTRLGKSWASIEALMDTGERCNGHDPGHRRAMAVGLWQLIQAAHPFVTWPGLPTSRFRHSQLWEPPHNVLFEFDRTAQGAEWIDGIATQARDQLRQSYPQSPPPLVVGHLDWSAKNMRVQGDRLSAVYDWDSLRLDSECVMVGNAAKGFLVTWYRDLPSLVPSPEQVREFVEDYETARGQAFTPDERALIVAAFLYSAAYTARCEHAVDPQGERWAGSFREMLKNHPAYLTCLSQ